jgi:hypothetical protein
MEAEARAAGVEARAEVEMAAVEARAEAMAEARAT